MKSYYIFAAKFALACAVFLTGFVSLFAQKPADDAESFATDLAAAEEIRPFDFSDKFYLVNGVEPNFIIDRQSGDGKDSVIDQTSDERFRNVRIRATFPAYGRDGSPVYFNLYGELFESGFLADEDGKNALRTAHFFPIYVFPSQTERGARRQANLIDRHDFYYEKNPLGLGVQVLIRFTDLITTPEGQAEMDVLIRKNGTSLDGTPIIKTVDEIADLTRKNLITQEIKGKADPSEPSFAIARVIPNPQRGAIAPDAFLSMVLNEKGAPLEAEVPFLANFKCLQAFGDWCDK